MPEFELELDPFQAEKDHEDDGGRFPLVSERRGSAVEGWRDELRSYLTEMQEFEGMDPVEVFLRLSAFSARAAEIRFLIIQMESRRATAFRTQAVDPFLEACEFQFRLFSRIQAVRDMEFKMSGGQV